MTEMRILTVRQPWAWAIVHGGKDVENRVRNLAGDYRGPVAIHAGLGYDEDAGFWTEGGAPQWFAVDESGDHREPRGAIIGVVDLVDAHSADDCWERDKQRLMSLYQSGPEGRREVASLPDDGPGGIIGKTRFCSSWAMDGHHHLVLQNPRQLVEPIPYQGGLGLRRLPGEVVEAVLAAVSPREGTQTDE